jgi:hypothetical protein
MTRFAGALIVTLATAAGMPSPAAGQMRPRDVDALPSRPADTRIPYGHDDLQFRSDRPTSTAWPTVRDTLLEIVKSQPVGRARQLPGRT